MYGNDNEIKGQSFQWKRREEPIEEIKETLHSNVYFFKGDKIVIDK